MIELLIVIAVIGILAVAVLAAINPIEQINRGKDTGSRSDAEQLIGAVDRFYTVKGYYPWNTTPQDIFPATTCSWQEVLDTWVDNAVPPVVVLNKLSAAGTAEIKLAFVNRLKDPGYNTLWVYNRGQQGDSTYVCFLPKSATFEDEAGKRCDAVDPYGALPADFPNAADPDACPTGCSAAKTCYACLP